MKPWTVLVRTIIFKFLSSKNDSTSPTFPFFRAATQGFVQFSLRRVLYCVVFALSVPRRKVFCCFPCVVSCYGARLRPCRVVTQSFLLFSLRRVLCGAGLRLCRAATQGFLLFSLRRVLCGAGLRPCLAVTQGFLLFSLRRVLLWWCEIAPLSCRDAKFCFVFPASRYYMGLFCSEMEHDAKFCADFFASCPLCMIW